MSDQFLARFLHVAKDITNMERGMVVNSSMELVEASNLEPEETNLPEFQELLSKALQRALERGEPIVTNNMITDPSQAPVTNTNFADLRVVVVFPLREQGALYLDQHIRFGIIPRAIVNRVMSLASYILDNHLENSTEGQMLELYQQIP